MSPVSHSTPSHSGRTDPSWLCMDRTLGSERQWAHSMGLCRQLRSVQRCVARYLRCVRQVTTRGEKGLSSIIIVIMNLYYGVSAPDKLIPIIYGQIWDE